MGRLDVDLPESNKQKRAFTKNLLKDLEALEYAIREGLFESDVRRIGAEQELFLIDDSWHPATRALELLEAIDDPHFTTELALFNLEANLDPVVFEGDCLARVEAQLREFLNKARQKGKELGVMPLMTGILPTLQQSDLGLDSMTPIPRYRALNDAVQALRGEGYQIHIKGVDELTIRQDTVMLEACNTSFQLHLQVTPEEFPTLYNLAQVVTAPLLAAACNSPFLFGRNLWAETRIAVFQQAVDTRSPDLSLRQLAPRVSFGTDWVHDSVLEIFREDVARFRSLLAIDIENDPFEQIRKGEPPTLAALQLHNGTVYRWNRPCYGRSGKKPHLRIENRVLPAGPTIEDEMANATFFLGMMCAVHEEYPDVRKCMTFDHAKANFIAAAEMGLRSQFHWLDGGVVPAQELIRNKLLPAAESALKRRGIDSADVEKNLAVIDQRVANGQNGARWMRESLRKMSEGKSRGLRLASVVAGIANRQWTDGPVHTWSLARLDEAGEWKPGYHTVGQFMTTDLFTVQEEDSLDLVANLMQWRKIRHVPVEDEQNLLCGLVSYRSLLKQLAETHRLPQDAPVRLLMKKEVVTVPPEMPTLEAIELMKNKQIGCLPITQKGRLVGIVTERDFLRIARELLEDQLRGG